MVKLSKKFSWNGELIITSDYMLPYYWVAVLDDYDPTPYDSNTPARGPRAYCGSGDSEEQAIADLLQHLVDQC